jgi:hypothetical protein
MASPLVNADDLEKYRALATGLSYSCEIERHFLGIVPNFDDATAPNEALVWRLRREYLGQDKSSGSTNDGSE